MSELLKRALEVCNELSVLRDRDAVVGVIEQALLAERRLAMELCAEQLSDKAASLHIENPVRWELFQQSASIRRAAAEKEGK